jgi:hypothetical protein
MHVLHIETAQGSAWVIDSVLSEDTLESMDSFRLSLSLDSKRPTVDRRFFADGETSTIVHPTTLDSHRDRDRDRDRPIASLLEDALQQSIPQQTCHVFRYQRFLEYTQVGSNLDPHTDGTKVCDDTRCTSTHTLLLYLTECAQGGETLLFKERKDTKITRNKDDPDHNLIYATQPKRGRILVFPHPTPHAGAAVVDVPKICLRAEVCFMEKMIHQQS